MRYFVGYNDVATDATDNRTTMKWFTLLWMLSRLLVALAKPTAPLDTPQVRQLQRQDNTSIDHLQELSKQLDQFELLHPPELHFTQQLPQEELVLQSGDGYEFHCEAAGIPPPVFRRIIYCCIH